MPLHVVLPLSNDVLLNLENSILYPFGMVLFDG